VKPTPPALKWLAEKRARIAGKLDQRERTLTELQSRVAKLRDDLAALDRTLSVYDSQIDALAIQPVYAWKGKYGKRGALKQFIAQVVESRSPETISTDQLALLAMAHFALDFPTSVLRKRWQTNTLLNALKDLREAGKVERLHDLHTGTVGLWRWAQPVAVTLADLRAAAARAKSPTPP
jgi:hypothetical protein